MRENSAKKRHQSESIYFNLAYSKEKAKKNFYSLGFKSTIFDRLLLELGSLEGKKVIDFGCGKGWQTRILASKGAEVWAFDVAEEAVRKTRDLVGHLNLRNKVHVDQMPAEKLIYESEMFDLIVGNAILHHLDLEAAIDEILRVLKKGGRAYFLEPLGCNPVINLYRKLTPELRTEDEVPLRPEHFRIIGRKFSRFEHEEYYFVSLLALFWYFVIRKENLFLKSRDLLFKIDNIVLRTAPFLKKYCWYTILMMEK